MVACSGTVRFPGQGPWRARCILTLSVTSVPPPVSAVTDTATSTVSLSGLEPAGPGEWLLDVEVELDRERGWLRTSYRLVVE